MKIIEFGRFNSLFCLLFFVFISSCSNPGISDTPDPHFHLYLLIGQSNMAGRGEVDELSTPNNSRLLMFNEDNEWEIAKDPVHFDKPKVAGVGPGLAFGLEMLEYIKNKKVKVGLIPCAVGGTTIEMWQPGNDAYNGQYHPYDDTIKRLHAAMKSGIVKGIIWHQGEGDSNEENAKVYLDQLEKLIQLFRNEVNNPELPFVAGELGYYRENSFHINNVLKHLPERISVTAVASAEKLKHNGDGTHFDSNSSRILGERFAKEMRVLQLKN